MKSHEGVLIQYDWCPYKKRRLGHRHTQIIDYVKTQEKDKHLQTKICKEEDLKRKTLPPPWP
jgi:hypothetical protein